MTWTVWAFFGALAVLAAFAWYLRRTETPVSDQLPERLARVGRAARIETPAHSRAQIPRDDADEREAGAGEVALDKGGQLVVIQYRDTYGQFSERRITIRSIDSRPDGRTYLRSWCHERRDWRSFRVDRIVTMADARTGEIFTDPCVFLAAELGVDVPNQAEPTIATPAHSGPPAPSHQPNLEPPREASDRTKARRAIEPIMDDLRVLTFLARIDGKFRAAEKAIIADYVMTRIELPAVDRAWLEGFVGRIASDTDAYLASVKALDWSSRPLVEGMHAALTKVADSDGVRHAGESEIIGFFERALHSLG